MALLIVKGTVSVAPGAMVLAGAFVFVADCSLKLVCARGLPTFHVSASRTAANASTNPNP
jgi:hypothetical protein